MQTTKSTHEAYKTELFAPVMKSTEGKYVAVLSDDSVDRDEEKVGKTALQKLDLKGYVAGLIDHENKVLNQVCEWVNKRLCEIDGHTALVAEPKFFESNPNAKIIKGMLDEGAQIGISIGAIVKDYAEETYAGKSMRVFTDLELLEASFVAIPSNRHGKAMAVAKSFKNKQVNKMEEDVKFTQKDIDSAVVKKADEMQKQFDDLNKQLESKNDEIAKLSEKVEEVEKAVSDKEEKLEKASEELAKAKEELEAAKKVALEKQKFAEQGGEEAPEDVQKAMKEGKLPVFKI